MAPSGLCTQVMLIAALFCLQSVCAQQILPCGGGNQQPTCTGSNGQIQYQDLYGFGVRLGFYLQGVAFLTAFLGLIKYDFSSQLTGTVLAFNNLIAWALRTQAQDYSLSEAWISLALALSITVPGSWVLYSVFVVQRAELRRIKGKNPAQRDLVRGRGLAIFLAVLSTGGAIVANTYFWFQEAANSQSGDLIWVLGTHSIDSSVLHGLMYAHAALVLTNVPLLLWLLSIWCLSVLTYNWPQKWKGNPPSPQDLWERMVVDQNETRKDFTCKWYSPRNRLIALLEGLVLGAYWVFLILSVELTIRDAQLQPLTSLEYPGQLIPLLSGGFGLASAIAALLRRETPQEMRPLERTVSAIPLRVLPSERPLLPPDIYDPRTGWLPPYPDA